MPRAVPLVASVLAGCLAIGTAWAGSNRDGALIVHADPLIVYSSGRDFCVSEYRGPSTCGNARTEVDGFLTDAILVWFIAAFPRNAHPAINAVQFGISSTLPNGAVVAHGPCGSSLLELATGDSPDYGWGTLVSFSTINDTFSPIYWFAIEGTGGSTFGSAKYPGDDRAVFVDDGNPPAEDDITRFGSVGWGTSGGNDCPPDAYEIRPSTWGKVKGGYR